MRLMMREVCRHPTDAAEDQWREQAHANFLSYISQGSTERKKRDRQTVLRFCFVWGFLSVFGCVNVCAHERRAHDWISSGQAGCKIPGAISSWADDLFGAHLHAWTVYLLLTSHRGLFSMFVADAEWVWMWNRRLRAPAGVTKTPGKKCVFLVYYTHL